MAARTNMTIDNAEYQGQENENENLKKDVFYRGARLLGGLINNNGAYICYTPEAMLECLNRYKALVKEEKYNDAREAEEENSTPYEWLNFVISNLIKESNNSLAEMLVNEFKDRGFSKAWLKNKH